MAQALRREIAAAEVSLEACREQYLRKNGWSLKCDTPGARWLWQKTLPDGRIVAVQTLMAVDIQDHWPK